MNVFIPSWMKGSEVEGGDLHKATELSNGQKGLKLSSWFLDSAKL